MVDAPLCLPQVMEPPDASVAAGAVPLPSPPPHPFTVTVPVMVPEALVQLTGADAPAVPAVATTPIEAADRGSASMAIPTIALRMYFLLDL
jgi:hypothetical protein